MRRRVRSAELGNVRNLLVALPPSYSAGDRGYPAVYLQDGQNLFDPATSFAGDWRLGPTLGELAGRGIEAIVVGIPHMGPRRIYEYGPFADPEHGGGGGDRYLDFVVGTVKPLVDRSFRTLPGPEHTVIGGASMGGLISLYGLFRSADCFGAAAVMSPALWFAKRAALRYVERAAPPTGARVYLDVGLLEPEGAVADARALRNILVESSARSELDLEYVEDPAGDHAEQAWGRRFGRALPFLLRVRSRPERSGG